MTTLNLISKLSVVFTTIVFSLSFLMIVSCNDQRGSNEDVKHSNIEPPAVDIHTAVISNNLDALKRHVSAGSNINEKDPFGGSTPLISAATFGKTEAARILIEAGAKLDVQNNDGSTALHSSAFFCRPEIVEMLLIKGADKTIKNNFNSTAYESVKGSFEEVKGTYEMMETMLGPMGLQLDYEYLEKTRPEIADMLK